jgi:glycosyltransferase involved in cell wall biosynthesis
VRKVFIVIPSLEYCFAARQVTLLAMGLPRERFDVQVGVLGTSSPWAEDLRQAGITVEAFGKRRPLDVAPFRVLRRWLAQGRPEVIHVWGQAALRAVALCGGRGLRPLVVSRLLPPGKPLRALDGWLLRRVGHVLALGAAEAQRYGSAGVAPERIHVVAPGMPLAEETSGDVSNPGLPPEARVMLGIGPIEPHKGFRDAVWTLDILAYLYPQLHLVLIGHGSHRPAIEDFARAIQVMQQLHFLGPCADLTPWLQRAEMVWAPGLRPGSVGAVLECMAAGKPVIASNLPDLAELVVEGVTGYLMPPGDKASLARRARSLLEDPERRRQFGAAARQRVAEHFSVAALVNTTAHFYETVAGR